MPQRSNEFQRLVASLESFVCKGGGTVVESAMMKNSFGEEFEVDVLVTHEFGGRVYKLAIECREHSRVQSVTWIRELVTKYQNTDLNKVIAVSNLGFSKKARDLAMRNNIDCTVLTRLLDWNWAERLNGGLFTLRRTRYENVRDVEIRLPESLKRPLNAVDSVRSPKGSMSSVSRFLRSIYRSACRWADRFLTERPMPHNLSGSFPMYISTKGFFLHLGDTNEELPMIAVRMTFDWSIRSEPKRLHPSVYNNKEYAVANEVEDEFQWQVIVAASGEDGLHNAQIDVRFKDDGIEEAAIIDFGHELEVSIR